MGSLLSLFAVAPKGMEDLLAAELESLGAHGIEPTVAGAGFRGDLATAYRVCLWSRLANRILLPLSQTRAESPDDLYRAMQTIDWSQHFGTEQTFAIVFNANTPHLRHSHFGALKAKDAVVDQFRINCGERPSVDTEQPDILINVHWRREQLVISLDLSGHSLHRRGYRLRGMAAPLKENLAAALLLRTRWPEIAAGGGAFVDPMCGSGTLLIEAALMAADIAPGLLQQDFGLLHWKQHRPELWQDLREQARRRRQDGLAQLPPLRGFDRSRKTLQAARENIRRAGLDDYIHLEACELAHCTPPARSHGGLLLTNPPYGERLGEEEQLQQLYHRLGQVLKNRFQGWQAGVFTARPELAQQLGLRARKIHSLFNGALACKLLHFDIAPRWYRQPQRFPRPLPATQRSAQAEMLQNRLRKNHKRLSRWLRREQIQCYRLYDHDLPEYAFAIDVYQGERCWVLVQEYQAPATVDKDKARQRTREALGVVLDELDIPPEQLYYKLRKPQKGREQYQKIMSSGEFHTVCEGGHRFLVNFTDYLDTGLFLDHRLTRQLIQSLATGKRFLNLFAYTGSVTVYAAKGGARSTTSVDLSTTYLDWARRNLELNDIDGNTHRLIRADCLQWLEQAIRENMRFELIFIDPPSFSNSKRMRQTFDVQRDHVALLSQAARLLSDDGVMIFSNNRRDFKLDQEALRSLFEIENLGRRTLPEDFRNNPKIHHCWRLRPARAGW